MTGPGNGPGQSRPRGSADDLLDRVLAADPPPFALLHRPEANGPGVLDLLIGTVSRPAGLRQIPVADPTPGGARHDVLALLPYRQIAERGFACPDDGTPLLTLSVTEQTTLTIAELLHRLPDAPITLVDGEFDPSDDEYARTVRQVVAEEIGSGLGANFVIKRSYRAQLPGYRPVHGLTLFRRLLLGESGAYWTFIVYTGERTLVGATPERHVSVRDGVAVMNPISGTYRYGPDGPDLAGVMDFLADRKEADELYMVVDEELKMMARICTDGARVVGPYLREMARLAHTEYFIEGRTDRDLRDVLAETMFAPTVTGSPLESACRVISRYEPKGRGYYSGVVALIGQDDDGRQQLDSAIVIRTADIDATGALRIGVGATLVRHSNPDAEVAETRAKAAGLLAALTGERVGRLASHPRVRAALSERNTHLAEFWLGGPAAAGGPEPRLVGQRVLVVDAEDTFTAMLDHQLRALGLTVTVRRFDEPYEFEPYDLVVMGPGPGDPRETGHPKIAHLHEAVRRLLRERRPFLAVCLSHQVLSIQLGLPMTRRAVPNQGTQRRINLFGQVELVGFYNTFAARSSQEKFHCDGVGMVQVSRDPHTGEVHALRGPHFTAIQFHAESVLTRGGTRILRELLTELLHR